MPRVHRESHLVERTGWLRAAVLGANDGILSTSSLVVGVASAAQSGTAIALTAIAGLVAGSLSMAAGEYVSVSSQADTEAADRAREAAELATKPEAERAELAGIYERRGLDPELAGQVADQLMAHDAIGAHLRDELGMSTAHAARPVQAALVSAASFAIGGALPLIIVLLSPRAALVWSVTGASLVFLVGLGAVGARAGGANIGRAVVRVTFWGAVAMATTAAVGALFGTSVT